MALHAPQIDSILASLGQTIAAQSPRSKICLLSLVPEVQIYRAGDIADSDIPTYLPKTCFSMTCYRPEAEVSTWNIGTGINTSTAKVRVNVAINGTA